MSEPRDSLGDRMKSQYEDRTRYQLPRRTYTILRLDGRAFSSFTRHCAKPFDHYLAEALNGAAIAVAEDCQGSQFGFVQSDEMSFLLTDFGTITTEALWNGNVQKIVSIAASVATARFVHLYGSEASFDARVFTIPDPTEVENYFIWRQKDAVRNSVSGLAQAHFSQKQLHGKKQADMHEMLHTVGVNWANECADFKHGRAVIYEEGAGWRIDHETPVFTQNRDYLTSRIPRYDMAPVSEKKPKCPNCGNDEVYNCEMCAPS